MAIALPSWRNRSCAPKRSGFFPVKPQGQAPTRCTTSLSMVRPDVYTLEEHSLGIDLGDVGPDMSPLYSTFFATGRQVTKAARILAERRRHDRRDY